MSKDQLLRRSNTVYRQVFTPLLQQQSLLIDTLPQQTLPQLTSALTIQTAKSILFHFNHLMTSNFLLSSIPFSPLFQ